MKKFCISLVIIFIIILTITLNASNSTKKEYLRIHVRANSNSYIDQDIKYQIKDKVVEYLTPYVALCDTKSKALKMIDSKLLEISQLATKILKEKNFNYAAKAKLTSEEFPLRVYDNLTLEQGIYDALILELGNAEGDNWWCVVYPPLCFTGEGEGKIKYRSKIIDIINKFNNK